MTDTQQSLSKLKEHYDKIKPNTESGELNNIISDANDELFAGLKEIVFSKKNTIHIQNDIRRIARNLEETKKKMKIEETKILKEITDIETTIQEKNDKKNNKEQKIITNDGEIGTIEGKITTKEAEVQTIDSEIKNEKKDKLKRIKEKTKEITKERIDSANQGKISSMYQNIEYTYNNIYESYKNSGKAHNDPSLTLLDEQLAKAIIEDEIKEKTDDLEETKKALQGEIIKFEDDIKKIKEENKIMEDELQSITDEIKSTKKQLDEKQENVDELYDNFTNLEEVIHLHNEIIYMMDLFNIDSDLQDQTIKLKRSGTISTIQDFLNDIHNRPTNLSFELYDGEDKKITGNKIKNIKLKNETIVNIEGVTINNNGEIQRNNVKVTDTTTNKEITDYPIEFEIEVGAKAICTGSLHKNIPNKDITMTNKKTLKIKIDIDRLNVNDRRTQLDAYNTTPLGGGHVIENRMTSLYTHKRARQEREAFFRALKNGDGPKLDNLNDDQKEDLFQRVRNMYRLPDQTPNAAVLTPHAVTGLTDINSYPRNLPLSFGERFTSDSHESVKDSKNIANVRAYMDYIHNNIDTQITKYFDRRFDRIFTDDQHTNTFLKAQVTNYMQEIDRNKTDNDMHMDVDADIHLGKNGNDRLHNRRRKILGMRIGRRDVGAPRFLSGSKKSITEQTVNISTNTHPEDLNNPEPEKYTLDLEVTPKNQFRVNIKIAGQEDFALKSGDPASLIRTVLRNDRIVNGKTRAHIAYNIIKGCIDMCKEKDISLRYRDPQTNHNMVIRTSDKNIIVEDQDSQTNYGGNNRRITQVLFDYTLFENTNTFEGNTNRSLRRGIDALMVHFTSAMNQLHDQYRLTTENKWRTKTKLPTSFFTSPIKKLLNLKTTTKFDFETTVTSSNGKKATVSLKKNTFTIMMDGLKKPIKGKSLGKLLEKRVGKVRIFDGIERDICGKVYESLITNMRKNTKIARSNFGVLDPMTGRAYIVDEDGEFGYIQAETIKQRNPIRRNNAAKIAGKAALTGGLVAGGLALGGGTPGAIAATLAAGTAAAAVGAVSPTLGAAAATGTVIGGAGTLALGAGVVSGINLAQYLWRNSNRKRGVVETPPQGRTMCNESEKRELLKNPFLMSGIIRAMSERLGRL